MSQAHEIKLGLLEKIRSGLQISLKMTHFGPICRQNTVVTHSRQKSLNLPFKAEISLHNDNLTLCLQVKKVFLFLLTIERFKKNPQK